ncbi:hypothetical protein HR065_01700, partial [Candidatus Phytoplasma pruni]|nr:hypothetical protein [Candidatus Phytoplasma pruni]
MSNSLSDSQIYREQKNITVEEVSDQTLRDKIQNQQNNKPHSSLHELTQAAKQLVDDRLTERANLRNQALSNSQTYREQQNITTEEVNDQFLKDAIKAKQTKTPTSTLEELTQEAKQLVDDRLTERKNLRDQALTDAQTYRTQQNITTEEVSDQNLRDAIQNQQTQTPTSTLEEITKVAKQLVDNRLLERTNLRNLALPAAQEYRQQQNITVEEVSDQFLKDAIKAKQTKTPTSTLEELTQEAKQLVDDRLTERKNLRDQALNDAQTYREKQSITVEEVSDEILRNAIQTKQNNEPTSILEELTQVAKQLVDDRITERVNLRNQAFSNSQTYREQKNITVEEVSDQTLRDKIQNQQTQTPTSTLEELTQVTKQLLDFTNHKKKMAFIKESLSICKNYREEKGFTPDEITDVNLTEVALAQLQSNPNSEKEEFVNSMKALIDLFTVETNETGKKITKWKNKTEDIKDWDIQYNNNENETKILKLKYDDQGKIINWIHEDTYTTSFDKKGRPIGLFRHKQNGDVEWENPQTTTIEYNQLKKTFKKYKQDGSVDWTHPKTYTVELFSDGKKLTKFLKHKENGDIHWNHENTYTCEYDQNHKVVNYFKYKENGDIHWNHEDTYTAEYKNNEKLVKRYNEDGSIDWTNVNTFTHEYDSDENLIKQLKYKANGDIHWDNENTFVREYDDNKNITKQITFKEDGKKDLEKIYNDDQNIISTFKYKENGDIHWNHEDTYTAEYKNNEKLVKRHNEDSSIDWTNDNTFTHEYDSDENLIKQLKYKANGDVHWNHEDTFTREYDKNKNITKQLKYKENGDIHWNHENTYGALCQNKKRKAKYKYKEDSTLDLEIVYNVNEKIIKKLKYKQDGEGSVSPHWDHEDTCTFDYDVNGKLWKKHSHKEDGGQDVTIEYDSDGNRIRSVKYKENGDIHWNHKDTYTVEYNDDNPNERLVKRHNEDSSIDWTNDNTFTHEYDSDENLIKQFKYKANGDTHWDH